MGSGYRRFIVGIFFAMMLPCAAKMQAKIASYPIANTILSKFSDAYGRRSKKNLAPLVVERVGGRSVDNFCEFDNNSPDVFVVHRRMTASDLRACSLNDVNDFVELELGHGGIVVLASPDLGLTNISAQELYSAIAKFSYRDGRVKINSVYTWSEFSGAGYELPAVPIKVLVPGANADLRDVFEDCVMVKGCHMNPQIMALKAEQPKLFRDLCLGVRSDKAVDDLKQNSSADLIKKIASERGIIIFASPDILLDPNAQKYIIAVDGHKPTYESIRDDSYPLSSPIYMYVKMDSLKKVKSLKSFLLYIFSAQNQAAHLSESAGFLSVDDTRRAQQFDLIKADRPNFMIDKTDFIDQAISFVRNARLPLPESPVEPGLPDTFAGTPLDHRVVEGGDQSFDPQAPAIESTIDDQLQSARGESDRLEVMPVEEGIGDIDSGADESFDVPARENESISDNDSLSEQEVPEPSWKQLFN